MNGGARYATYVLVADYRSLCTIILDLISTAFGGRGSPLYVGLFSFVPCFVAFCLCIIIFSCPVSCLLFFLPLAFTFPPFCFPPYCHSSSICVLLLSWFSSSFISRVNFFNSVFVLMFLFSIFCVSTLSLFFIFSCWRSLVSFASYPLFHILFFVPSFSLPFPFMHVSRIYHCDSCPNMHTDAILMPVSGNYNYVTM